MRIAALIIFSAMLGACATNPTVPDTAASEPIRIVDGKIAGTNTSVVATHADDIKREINESWGDNLALLRKQSKLDDKSFESALIFIEFVMRNGRGCKATFSADSVEDMASDEPTVTLEKWKLDACGIAEWIVTNKGGLMSARPVKLGDTQYSASPIK